MTAENLVPVGWDDGSSPAGPHPRPLPFIPITGVSHFVRDLALKVGVAYTRTPSDRWAETVTRLVGGEVESGPVQDLLVALHRAGKLSTDDMVALLVNYLREREGSGT